MEGALKKQYPNLASNQTELNKKVAEYKGLALNEAMRELLSEKLLFDAVKTSTDPEAKQYANIVGTDTFTFSDKAVSTASDIALNTVICLVPMGAGFAVGSAALR